MAEARSALSRDYLHLLTTAEDTIALLYLFDLRFANLVNKASHPIEPRGISPCRPVFARFHGPDAWCINYTRYETWQTAMT